LVIHKHTKNARYENENVMIYIQECIWFDTITFVVYLLSKDFKEYRLLETLFT
jgi:uncharacterized membrane protein